MKNIILLFALVLGFTGFSQKITIKVNNQENATVNLIKYVGKSLFYADTAEIVDGVVTFDASKQEPGIIGLLTPDKKYFEFVYNNEDISLEVDYPNFIETIKVKKSKENQVFIAYIKSIQANRKKADELGKARETETNEDKKEEYTQQIKQIGEEVKAFQKGLIDKHPNYLTSKIIKMSMELEIPDAPLNAQGEPIDTLFKYHYYRDHFFDNIDFKDDRLVNVPVVERKLNQFLSDRVLIQIPDTLIKYITPVMAKLPDGSMMYRFFTTKITSHFEKSKIMGMDKVFNYMVNNYYCGNDSKGNPKAYWMEEDKLTKLCKDVSKRSNTEIGVTPPNIILPDTTDVVWRDFKSLPNEYVILYFWDPECGHCKKETPKLEKLYAEKLKARDVEIFSIGKATGDDFEKWKAYIKKNKLSFINVGLTKTLFEQASENPRKFVPSKTTMQSLNYMETYDIYSTPRVFVLDKDRKIIAKQLSISQLEDYMDRIQKIENPVKLIPADKKIDEDAH